jgi:hypothetical protein
VPVLLVTLPTLAVRSTRAGMLPDKATLIVLGNEQYWKALNGYNSRTCCCYTPTERDALVTFSVLASCAVRIEGTYPKREL